MKSNAVISSQLSVTGDPFRPEPIRKEKETGSNLPVSVQSPVHDILRPARKERSDVPVQNVQQPYAGLVGRPRDVGR